MWVTRNDILDIVLANVPTVSLVVSIFLSLFILRDRDSTSGGGADREEREERIPSKLCAASTEPDAGPEPTQP